MTADFYRDLAESHRHQDEPIWEVIYRNAVPDLVRIETPKHNLKLQKQGVDRILFFSNNSVRYVEEKRRLKDWGDFAFEILSSVEHSTPGWAEKPSAADYFAWVVDPDLKRYPNEDPRPQALIFDAKLLLRAWRQNRRRWKRNADSGVPGYAFKDCPNKGYRSRVLTVPLADVYLAIGQASTHRFSKVRLASLIADFNEDQQDASNKGSAL